MPEIVTNPGNRTPIMAFWLSASPWGPSASSEPSMKFVMVRVRLLSRKWLWLWRIVMKFPPALVRSENDFTPQVVRRHSNMEGPKVSLVAVFQGVTLKRTGQVCTYSCLSLAADGQNNPMTATVIIFAGCFRQSKFELTYKYCSYHKNMFKQPWVNLPKLKTLP